MSVISRLFFSPTKKFHKFFVALALLGFSSQNLAAQNLGPHPSDEQISARLNGSAWDPGANGSGPVLIVPAEKAAIVKMSLSRFSAHQQRKELDKFSKAQAVTPYTLKMPKPQPNPSRAVDIWTKAKLDTRAMGARTPGFDGHIGADIKLNRNLLLGTSAQLIEKKNVDGTTEEGHLTGPYLAMQLSPNLKFNAKTAWGKQQNTALKDTPDIHRQTSSAQLSGHWKWNSFTVAPSAALIHEKIAAPGQSVKTANAKSSSTSKTTRLDIRPEIRRPFQLDGGEVVEPFINFSGSIDLDANETHNSASKIDRIGAGMRFSNPSQYNVQATTQIEGLGSDQAPDLKSRLNVTVPLQ